MTPIEYAASRDDVELLSMLVGAIPRAKAASFELCKNTLINVLKATPDFSVDMAFTCDSPFIPFIKSLTPSDTYKIYKRGSQVRVDLKLLSWTETRGVRGNLSIVFKGREGSLLLVNHDTKTVESIFADLSDKAIEMDVEEILKKQRDSELRLINKTVIIIPGMTYGKPITKIIDGYICKKYQANCTYIYDKKNCDLFKRYETYKDYYENSLNYFALNQNNEMVTGVEKKYEATLWMTDEYALKYNQFAPILNILKYASDYIGRFSSLFTECCPKNGSFPLMINIPLCYSIQTNINIGNLQFISMNPRFMNMDINYTIKDSYYSSWSICEQKFYPPIASIDFRTLTPGVNTSRNEFPSLAEDNDRLRWTSYESDEESSISWTKEKFENLFKNTSNDNTDKDESIMLDIRKDARKADEFDLLEKETGLTSTRVATDNIKAYSGAQIKTLNSIQSDEIYGKDSASEYRRRSEMTMKKIVPKRIRKTSLRNDGLNTNETQEEKKLLHSESMRKTLEQSGALNFLMRNFNNVKTARNSSLRIYSETRLSIYKKTVDIDIVLNPI